MKIKPITLEKIIKNPNNNYPIIYQNINAVHKNKMKTELPHYKVIEIDKLGTFCYPIDIFYKPISRIFIFNDDEYRICENI